MEDIIISFKDSLGKPYNWHIPHQYLKAGYQEQALTAIARNVSSIEVIHADDKNVHLEVDQFKIRKVDQVARDAKKRNKAKIKKDLQKSAPKAAPKPRSSHWIFTPNEVLRLNTETLINRLLDYAANDGDVDIFLTHLRMMKAIYNADCFDLGDRKIQGYQIAELMLALFKGLPFWTDQMFLAYDEFNYLFSKQARRSLQVIRSKEKKRQAREQMTTAAPDAADPETSETATVTEESAETAEPVKKKATKKQRQLLKKLNPQPKKSRTFASMVQQLL